MRAKEKMMRGRKNKATDKDKASGGSGDAKKILMPEVFISNYQKK